MSIGWYLHRLRAMSAPELWHRVTERWKHRSDAGFAERVRPVKTGARAPGVPHLPEATQAPASLKQRLAEDAAGLQAGRWHLFGWREVQLACPPSWHRDPLGEHVTSKDRLAHRLNHRSLPAGVDVRTLWEISRWSEMVRLAMHGWLNQDAAAISTARDWLEDWVQENPAGYGIHWTSPLEVGLRLINFTWFDALVEATGDATLQERQSRLTQLVVVPHALWVWRYLSFGSSANNHLLGELAGLLHAVKRWPVLETVVCPAGRLWSEVERCVLEQFAPDGGNREQALHYHLFAWEMAWHCARLMKVERGEAWQRLLRAATFFTHAVQATEPWHYGDSDDAEVVPLCLDRHLAEGEWQAWLMGRTSGESLRFWLGTPPKAAMATSGWWVAPDSGMAVYENHGWKLRVDASPLGYGAMAAHGHGDALHLSVWDGDLALLIDPGTGGYYGMKEQRNALAAWEAHNGPQPTDGFQTPRRLGTFLLLDHHGVPRLEDEGGRLTASLQHEGRDWKRSVTLVGDDQITIEDTVTGGAAFDLRTRWHFAPEVEVTPAGQAEFLLQRNGRRWRVVFENATSCALMTGLASRRYGSFEDCPVIEVVGELNVKSVWTRE
ncbi:heparinase II/III-family protein [Verrucomicrobium sp. BvORR106]|uniref:heparinase II/III family protein n=1 Tax=Verrucomicrobium sp. BvORR106 TaxID=1403819 RepID=UPI00224104EB|nr:heparinase II/III-family protein [Verrucomicrobium sp. BvORR106]